MHFYHLCYIRKMYSKCIGFIHQNDSVVAMILILSLYFLYFHTKQTAVMIFKRLTNFRASGKKIRFPYTNTIKKIYMYMFRHVVLQEIIWKYEPICHYTCRSTTSNDYIVEFALSEEHTMNILINRGIFLMQTVNRSSKFAIVENDWLIIFAG